MTQAIRQTSRWLPVAALGFIAGTMLNGVVQAVPDPAPGPPLPVREQNLDASGWIKVHEQGTANVAGTVDIANFPSSIAISNFPATQDVNVVGGQLDLAPSPVTSGFSVDFCAEAGEFVVTTLPSVINATNVSIANFSDEIGVYFISPIAMQGGGFAGTGPSVFSHRDDAGDGKGMQHAFSRPVPISQVKLQCINESDPCCIVIDIVGTPGTP